MMQILRSSESDLALLEYRSTQTTQMSTLPIQRLLGHATRSILPTENDSKHANNTKQTLMEKHNKRLVSQSAYNKSAHDLPTLKVGSPVLLRDISSLKTKWRPGKIVEQLSGRSYAVLTQDNQSLVRRNRVDL